MWSFSSFHSGGFDRFFILIFPFIIICYLNVYNIISASRISSEMQYWVPERPIPAFRWPNIGPGTQFNHQRCIIRRTSAETIKSTHCHSIICDNIGYWDWMGSPCAEKERQRWFWAAWIRVLGWTRKSTLVHRVPSLSQWKFRRRHEGCYKRSEGCGR
jgi:hypothetical protein